MEYTASEMSQMGRLHSHYPLLHNNREELGELSRSGWCSVLEARVPSSLFYPFYDSAAPAGKTRTCQADT